MVQHERIKVSAIPILVDYTENGMRFTSIPKVNMIKKLSTVQVELRFYRGCLHMTTFITLVGSDY